MFYVCCANPSYEPSFKQFFYTINLSKTERIKQSVSYKLVKIQRKLYFVIYKISHSQPEETKYPITYYSYL